MAAPRLIDRESVLSLAHEGLLPAQIAVRIRRPASARTISRILAEARHADPTLPLYSRGRSNFRRMTVESNLEMVRTLDREAARRGMKARQLAGLLLKLIVEGKLISAVLDDGS